MHDFELLLLNAEGAPVEARSFAAKDDLEALLAAERAASANTVEVWEGRRRVARVKRGNEPLLTSDRTSL